MEYVAMQLKYGRRKVYAICIGYKQSHQAILIMQGDLGGFKYGDKVQLNLNTLDLELIERGE